MANAVAESLNNLTVNLHGLKQSIENSYRVRCTPQKKKTTLEDIASDLCTDAETIDLEVAIRLMDQVAIMAMARGRAIDRVTKAIEQERASAE